MKIKILSLHLFLLSMLLTNHSFAQSSSTSSIPNTSSSQEDESPSNTSAPEELNVDLSATKNYSIKLKAGDELSVNVNNPDNLYHSGENQPCNSKDDNGFNDIFHRLCTSFYSDSWNPLTNIFSLEKEYDLDQETGNPLVYHFKAVRRGNTYIYFHTTYLDRPSIYVKTTIPKSAWIGPKITVEVSE